jgi:hypothetical protein
MVTLRPCAETRLRATRLRPQPTSMVWLYQKYSHGLGAPKDAVQVSRLPAPLALARAQRGSLSLGGPHRQPRFPTRRATMVGAPSSSLPCPQDQSRSVGPATTARPRDRHCRAATISACRGSDCPAKGRPPRRAGDAPQASEALPVQTMAAFSRRRTHMLGWHSWSTP